MSPHSNPPPVHGENVVNIFSKGVIPTLRHAPETAITISPRRTPRDVDMAEIARRLGICDNSWRTIIDTIRTLHTGYGFPAPKTPRLVKGALIIGGGAIIRRSKFPRARVEDWFDNHLSPAQRAVDDGNEAATAAASLAANARQLLAVAGNR